MIKAIETRYKGYRFRSRLEARWAVFFDILDISWEYEKEGFDLDGVWYLPDFWLPELKCWVEIKGQEPTLEENEKARLLALGTKETTFILWGSLEPFRQERITLRSLEESKAIFKKTGEYCPTTDIKYYGTLGHRFKCNGNEVYLSDTFYRFAECRECHKVEIVFLGLCSELSCSCHSIFKQKKIDEIHAEALVEYESTMIEVVLDSVSCRRCYETPRLVKAYAAARQARFEHGEQGYAP